MPPPEAVAGNYKGQDGKLVKAAPIRRVRRIAGLLREFRDAAEGLEHAKLCTYYERAVENALREALDERG